jgi:serine beta-lactamase-like protein LACTB, mitochondrial
LEEHDHLRETNACLESKVYNIGSLSKAVTAVAIMKLFEQRKIDLDDPISKYVPEFPDKGSPITIRQIMTHTNGIRHYRPTDFPGSLDNENWKPYASFADAIKIFKDDPLLFKPGEYFYYSSYAVNLLQGVVEKVTAMSFEDYMRKDVWLPAGMINTSFDVPERIVPNRAKGYMQYKGHLINNPYGDLTYKFASGGMISTVEDLVRFGVALNHGGLLKPKTTAMMYEPQLKNFLRYQPNGASNREDEFEQAFLWRVRKDTRGRSFIYQCGTVKGFNACLVNYVDEDLIVAIANNLEAIGFLPALEFAEFFRPPCQVQTDGELEELYVSASCLLGCGDLFVAPVSFRSIGETGYVSAAVVIPIDGEVWSSGSLVAACARPKRI